MRCIEVLDAGEPLVLFPEGERKSGPIVQPLLDGAVYIALKTRRADHPGGHRWLGEGDAQGREVHPPAQDRGDHRRADPPVLDDSGKVPRLARRDLSVQLHDELQRLFDLAQIKANG